MSGRHVDPSDRPSKRHEGPRSWVGGDEAQRLAGGELLEELLRLYANCNLSATSLCRLCHLCHEAGCRGGAFREYAFTGRDAQRHLDAVLPRGGEILVQKVPMCPKKGVVRELGDVPMRVLWSSVEEELRSDPSIIAKLDNPATETGTVLDTPIYKAHPIVRSAKRKPLPLSVYLDGVQFISQSAGRSEAVLGLWLENLISSRRHFICGLKAADFCRCGCRSWCTLQPVFQRIEWMVHAMQCGKVPVSNPDNTRFTPDREGMRVGAPLTRPAVLVWVKGDWAEHVHSLGLSSWSSEYAPCQYCSMSKTEINEKGHLMCSEVPGWPLRTAADYDRACRSCEIDVYLASDADTKRLSSVLKWSRDKKVIGGRVVYRSAEINGKVVQVGDRLEPSAILSDIAQLENLTPPCVVTLWRSNKAGNKICDPISHRCPLFSRRILTSPSQNLAADALHTINLGISMKWCSAAVWRVLLMDVFKIGSDNEKTLESGMVFLRSELDAFQLDHRNEIDPSRRLETLTLKMMGKRRKCTVQDGSFLTICLLAEWADDNMWMYRCSELGDYMWTLEHPPGLATDLPR